MDLYGYESHNIIDVFIDDSRIPKGHEFLEEYKDILRELKDNMQLAQN